MITLLFLCFALPACINDIKTMHIPDGITLTGSIIFFLYYVFFNRMELISALIGAAIIFILFYIVRKLTKNGLGFGDVKYSILCGLYCAFPTVIFGCIFSAVLGLCVYGVIAAFKGYAGIRQLRIPFAPFMTAGVILAFFII